MKYRLNRAISATGFCSRRKADEYIAAGRVSVNGKTIGEFHFEVDLEADELRVDNRPLTIQYFDYILLYKPAGIVTTCNDEFERRNVLDLLPSQFHHVRPVGRLDLASEGLLILTNDGDLTQWLTHPSHTVFKRYEVTVEGAITTKALEQLAAGVRLDDGMTLPANVQLINKAQQRSTFALSIREGRNRQIRRMCMKVGYPVKRLVRVGIGGLQLRSMQPGDWRTLTSDEIQMLRSDT